MFLDPCFSVCSYSRVPVTCFICPHLGPLLIWQLAIYFHYSCFLIWHFLWWTTLLLLTLTYQLLSLFAYTWQGSLECDILVILHLFITDQTYLLITASLPHAMRHSILSSHIITYFLYMEQSLLPIVINMLHIFDGTERSSSKQKKTFSTALRSFLWEDNSFYH